MVAASWVIRNMLHPAVLYSVAVQTDWMLWEIQEEDGEFFFAGSRALTRPREKIRPFLNRLFFSTKQLFMEVNFPELRRELREHSLPNQVFRYPIISGYFRFGGDAYLCGFLNEANLRNASGEQALCAVPYSYMHNARLWRSLEIMAAEGFSPEAALLSGSRVLFQGGRMDLAAACAFACWAMEDSSAVRLMASDWKIREQEDPVFRALGISIRMPEDSPVLDFLARAGWNLGLRSFVRPVWDMGYLGYNVMIKRGWNRIPEHWLPALWIESRAGRAGSIDENGRIRPARPLLVSLRRALKDAMGAAFYLHGRDLVEVSAREEADPADLAQAAVRTCSRLLDSGNKEPAYLLQEAVLSLGDEIEQLANSGKEEPS